ncbi:Spt16/Cdc68-like protein [Ordospora pajunii]|uniref:Spt16/Cdc68-like protein n=1 Tax=Ordospora pajunii TaxID=3039483 RepID=UPI0029526346|nr:Spt16/Cdc68-like protein [Ordospora pajunii]KAH9411815.1 Spt16/Cdc68-like protein [Ordospora pajunii]
MLMVIKKKRGGDEMISLNAMRFERNANEIRKRMDRPLVVMLGKGQDVVEFRINSAVFVYLLGYEFPETVLVIGERCVAVTSQKRVEILRQVGGLEVIVRSKESSGIEEIRRVVRGHCYVVGADGIEGEFCRGILDSLEWEDAGRRLEDVFITKDEIEVEKCKAAGQAVSVLLKRGVEMLWDGRFYMKKLEEAMAGEEDGIDMSKAEFSFPVEYDRGSVRIGVRLDGYCSEASRTIVVNMDEMYEAQEFILNMIRPGVSSADVYCEAQKYFASNGVCFGSRFVYTIGLLSNERGFDEGFMLSRGCVFVVSLRSEGKILSNTFVLRDVPEYLTSKDTAFEFVKKRSRFRNKTKEYELGMRRREHQKELIDELIEERLQYYRGLEGEEGAEDDACSREVCYTKEGQVPRHGRLVVDYLREAVVIPIGSYAVPFHVSDIKSVAVTDSKGLRINFKTEPRASDGSICEEESVKGVLSLIKSINISGGDSKEYADEINGLRKAYLAKGSDIKKEAPCGLVISQKPFVLNDLHMRTDAKSGSRKKQTGDLEVHANGFRYGEVVILFANVRHVFFSEGEIENSTILHLHLNASLTAGERIFNVQFYQDASSNLVHDTMKRGDEHMEYIIEKEEQQRQEVLNARFMEFVRRIEAETPMKVQIPHDGFYGVPFKENVMIKQTHECLVSVEEAPYFVLSLEDIEVVNFERVVSTVKTVDVLFILKNKHPVHVVMKNKSRLLVSIQSVDVQSVDKLKDYLDLNNVLFMETSVSIRWTNVIASIMKDPISFYEDGAWSGLMVGDNDEPEEESEVSEESSVSESESIDTDDDVSSEEPDESEDYESEDSEEDDDESDDESYESEKPKKKRRN